MTPKVQPEILDDDMRLQLHLQGVTTEAEACLSAAPLLIPKLRSLPVHFDARQRFKDTPAAGVCVCVCMCVCVCAYGQLDVLCVCTHEMQYVMLQYVCCGILRIDLRNCFWFFVFM